MTMTHAKHRNNKTIDLHIILEGEFEGANKDVIKSIQKEKVITLPRTKYSIVDYLGTNYHFELMEKVEHPSDTNNAYYHRISVHEAIEKGYNVRQFVG